MARPVVPDPGLVAKVRAAIERTSTPEVARRLDLAEATTARLAAGLPVQAGTVAIAEQHLPALEAA